ncbi:MAG: hypothetical protein IKI57_01835 [Clostridia bacterium]|nr:hypothetical protein [Clostridia bacterium]
MYSRLNCFVHKTRYDDIMQLIEKKKGIMSTIQPEENGVKPRSEGDFMELEINFENLNDLNAFIYGAYQSYGVYFYVATIAYVTTVF